LSGFCFLSLITDAYSHMIIGYTLAPKLEFHYTESALDMALATIPEHPDGLIHHSDRGIQYAYPSYTNKLRDHHITISMTEHGDPLENAMAERVNGILKQEWLSLYEFKDIHHVRLSWSRPLRSTIPEGLMPASTSLLLSRLRKEPERSKTGGKGDSRYNSPRMKHKQQQEPEPEGNQQLKPETRRLKAELVESLLRGQGV
jgi:transposase InsO family protein